MTEHVLDGFSQPTVGFGKPVTELRLHPSVQAVHHWLAVGLVEGKALFRTHLRFFGLFLVFEDLA